MPSEEKLLLKQLDTIISEEPLVICIGNELRGDDGAGINFGQNLLNGGYENTILVFDTPENYLQKIISMPGNCRLWVDVMNWGANPGSFNILDPTEVQHFAISTHNYSPVVLLEFLRTYRDIPDYFLGIQPLDISLGNQITQPVSATIKQLSDFFLRNA
jgi:hydrogenase 3 maturation protease